MEGKSDWLLLVVLVAVPSTCTRLQIINTGPSSHLFKEGETAVVECQTTSPWFVCVWTGPGDLALHYGEGDGQGHGAGPGGHRVSSRNGNRVCRLHIPEIRRKEAGVYRCVLADREEVQTVDKEVGVEVGYPVGTVRFLEGPNHSPLQGSELSFLKEPEGETEIELACTADGGNPQPTFVIDTTNRNITLKATEQGQSAGRAAGKTVRFSARESDNNTVVYCRAEQRDKAGVLIYSTTESVTLRPVLILDPAFMGTCVGVEAAWWCGYELILYLILVFALLFLVTCCGVCFCCATRRRAKKLKYPTQQAEFHDSQEGLLKQSAGILKHPPWQPTFFPPPAQSSPVVPPASSMNFQQPVVQQKVLLESCFDEDTSGLDSPRPHSQPSTIGEVSGNFYLDDTLEGERTIEEEIARRKGMLLTEYEETIINNRRTETIETIEERLRRINLNRSMSNVSDSSDLADEVKKYEAHLYSLQDCADVSSRDLSYSQVVKEHLSHNPSLNVSRNDVTFSVPAPVSKLRLAESQTVSRTQSPMPWTPIAPSPLTIPSMPLLNIPSMSTLPIGARLPAHRPTNLSTLPPSGNKPATDEERRADSNRAIVEKLLSSSRELLASASVGVLDRGVTSPEPCQEENKEESNSAIVAKLLGSSRELLSPRERDRASSPRKSTVTTFEESFSSRTEVTTTQGSDPEVEKELNKWEKEVQLRQLKLKKAEEERKQEELVRQEEERKQEELLRQEVKRKQEELGRLEEERKHEELVRQEEERKCEEVVTQEEERKCEEVVRQEEERKHEELLKQEEDDKQDKIKRLEQELIMRQFELGEQKKREEETTQQEELEQMTENPRQAQKDTDSGETDSDNNESFKSIVEKHLGMSCEALSDHKYTKRQVSLDGSCFTEGNDFDIVDPNCSLAPEDVKKAFTDLRDQKEQISKATFVNRMMAFFPKYNMEENQVKLEKLFERLDGNGDGQINFRQFMLVTIAFSNVSLEDKLTRIFRLIDEDHNGELTYEEFEEVVHDILVLKEERKLSTSLVESRFSANTFRHMGMNAEGKVILRDFVDACTQQKFILINYVENFRDGFQSS